MATYKQIAEDVKKRINKTVKSCHIAHVKSMHGLTTRTAPNRISINERVYPCPDELIKEIEFTMRKFKMIE
ncbi:hypothetical protein [Providencia rettgeri]|uniref:hypothetical protein n=1 Tax=Providencia rettgeri TaxID=587 RepID=UPI001B38C504|nr:hypothetical protein [Providencia rettgeri]MBQ0366142.1 hypothetical protein [Providencia rettgeri]